MYLKDINENTVIICKCGAVFGSKSEAVKHARTHTRKYAKKYNQQKKERE